MRIISVIRIELATLEHVIIEADIEARTMKIRPLEGLFD